MGIEEIWTGGGMIIDIDYVPLLVKTVLATYQAGSVSCRFGCCIRRKTD